MAERRMFAKTIVLSDAFLDMPLGARCLYMTMGMLADDDGFVNAPKSIMRQCGASDDDLKVLIAKKFVLPFESGVIVIKHWRINNYLQKDRVQPTKYIDEMAMLTIDENGAYTQPCIQGNVYIDKNSIDKDSIDKVKKEEGVKPKRFTPPSLEDVKEYCESRNNGVDPQAFFDFYTSKGWKIGKETMKDWQAAVRTWERREEKQPQKKKQYTPAAEYKPRQIIDVDAFNKLNEMFGGINEIQPE